MTDDDGGLFDVLAERTDDGGLRLTFSRYGGNRFLRMLTTSEIVGDYFPRDAVGELRLAITGALLPVHEDEDERDTP